jgi:hypothetical protein
LSQPANPTYKAVLADHAPGLRGLHNGLAIAVATLDRVIATPAATVDDVARAYAQALIAGRNVLRKLEGMGPPVAAMIAADEGDEHFRSIAEVVGPVIEDIRARYEADGVGPPKPCAKVLQFTGPTRRGIEHGGPVGPQPPSAA